MIPAGQIVLSRYRHLLKAAHSVAGPGIFRHNATEDTTRMRDYAVNSVRDTFKRYIRVFRKGKVSAVDINAAFDQTNDILYGLSQIRNCPDVIPDKNSRKQRGASRRKSRQLIEHAQQKEAEEQEENAEEEYQMEGRQQRGQSRRTADESESEFGQLGEEGEEESLEAMEERERKERIEEAQARLKALMPTEGEVRGHLYRVLHTASLGIGNREYQAKLTDSFVFFSSTLKKVADMNAAAKLKEELEEEKREQERERERELKYQARNEKRLLEKKKAEEAEEQRRKQEQEEQEQDEDEEYKLEAVFEPGVKKSKKKVLKKKSSKIVKKRSKSASPSSSKAVETEEAEEEEVLTTPPPQLQPQPLKSVAQSALEKRIAMQQALTKGIEERVRSASAPPSLAKPATPSKAPASSKSSDSEPKTARRGRPSKQ